MPTLAEAASYRVPINLNQMTSANGTALTWDNNGNLEQHGTTGYQWTHGNRLWRAVKPTSTTEYASVDDGNEAEAAHKRRTHASWPA
ncbi:hypothetical protein [Brevundimonas sp.]|uniref:hypothetical protein n=1 Tax=Brevundimonas sp. TaxID=1871086 RepID=UPI002D3BB8EA|nr:hypothetical protein [Brevundimonas sp.]HYC98004.1 hypothetical protein [Brevundimonas sp.]